MLDALCARATDGCDETLVVDMLNERGLDIFHDIQHINAVCYLRQASMYGQIYIVCE
jgi:predicted RNA-binding Zn ribbon-like protein